MNSMPFKLLLVMLFPAMTACAQMPTVEPGVSHDLAKWRAARYSDVRYKLDLTLEKMSPVLKGTIEIRVKLSEPPASAGGQNDGVSASTIILDWRKIKGHEEKSTVSNLQVNGKLVATSTNWPPANAGGSDYNEHLIFRDGVVSGENVIKLDFTSPILTSGSAITRYVDKEDGVEYIYSLFVPSDASTAFPVFDQPDLKARFSLTVFTPEVWRVISNENISTLVKGPTTTEGTIDSVGYQFVETKPISTYVFAFAAGIWTDVASEVDPATHIFVRKSQAAKFKPHASEVFRLNREGIKYLEQYFDYKFPFPKYDIVLIPEFPFGGMEHAGATFLREDRVIFPQEPTKNDYITRANLIFHEAAHQWFGDTVTMKWFDDLWLKEGFAEFMAYKTLEKVMPEYNAWKIFYERNKQAAYLTDSTKGTTPIYQEIANLNSAKSAYGNIVYRKAPSFLKQAEFYIGPDKFQTAVRAFLKKHEFANAGWEDLVKEFEAASGKEELRKWWAMPWVRGRGMPIFDLQLVFQTPDKKFLTRITQRSSLKENTAWTEKTQTLIIHDDGRRTIDEVWLSPANFDFLNEVSAYVGYTDREPKFVFPNYQDYGYGIFLLDDKSRDYVLKNIQNEKDDFLRAMMWGSLWDSVREGELDPKEYVDLVVKVLGSTALSPDFSRPTAAKRPAKAGTQNVETDESTIQTLLGRVSTAMRYYIEPKAEPPALAGGTNSPQKPAFVKPRRTTQNTLPPANAGGSAEDMLIERMQNASTPGQRITYYRSFLNIGSSDNARRIMKLILKGSDRVSASSHSTKDRFDIVARLIVLGDPEAQKLLADLEKTETSDEAKRYAYAAKAGIATAENKAKYWSDFINNKDISESWIEAAFGPFNNVRQSDLTLPYLEKALTELPNLKRSRKIFFVNGWLGAFIGGQKSEEALAIVNKFLVDNPKLDNDLRLKILENVDLIERAVKIRGKFGAK